MFWGHIFENMVAVRFKGKRETQNTLVTVQQEKLHFTVKEKQSSSSDWLDLCKTCPWASDMISEALYALDNFSWYCLQGEKLKLHLNLQEAFCKGIWGGVCYSQEAFELTHAAFRDCL